MVSTTEPGPGIAPSFGGGTRVYNVIDSRQSFLQDVVAAGLRALGFNEQADRSVHFSYEMVALSMRCAARTRFADSRGGPAASLTWKSQGERVGRQADDLVDKLIEAAQREVDSRHPEADAESAVGWHANRHRRTALLPLKYTRNSVIAFDFQEALSFEGETGPYVQYTAVRARNILRKLAERGGRCRISALS
jgi:arginyl-tRNA synthetase